MISITDVRKKYAGAAEGEEALRGCSLEIEEGEFVAIVGTSGSGKTTLLNVIGGLDTTYSGRVEVFGRDLKALSDRELAAFRNRQIGFVFQHFSLLDHLTALENVALPFHFAQDTDGIDPVARATEALTDLGLGAKLHERPGNLSGGQKQRLAIARMLLKDPAIVILDEATSHLDTENEAHVQEALAEALRGRTSLVIAHRLSTITDADQILVLDDGRIVERGTHDELRHAGGLYEELYETLVRAEHT